MTAAATAPGIMGRMAEENIPWKRCPGCGEEFLKLAASGKCGLCTEREGGHVVKAPPTRPLTLRDRVRLAREEIEQQRYG